MKTKRASLFFAVLVLLSLIAAACAEPPPVSDVMEIEAPATASPSNTEAVVESPVQTEPPAQTELPAQTQLPAQTEPPAQTQLPMQTIEQAGAPGDPSATQATAGEAEQEEQENEEEFPYYLYFEKGSYTLTIYEKDADGAYTQVYKTYRAAHGGNKTPAGVFQLHKRERWHEFPDGGFVQFATRYHNRLYIHSPLYGKENPGYLWKEYYDGSHKIGSSSTGGCLRMVTEAARFIYENCPDGTTLEIVNGAPRETTSEDPPSRNGKRYDPTDIEVQGQ